jgi:integrase
MGFLRPDEAARFLATAKGHRLYALFLLAITSGLRKGELLALHWEDIDLDGHSLTVRHTLNDITGTLTLGEPKTASSKRRVDLSPSTVAALKEHRKAMLADGLDVEWVFCDGQGGPLRQSNLSRRDFKPLLKQAGLPDIRFHDLRHTAATLMLSQGVHIKVVSEMFGHTDISLTMGTYSHSLPSMQRDAAAKLDGVLFPSQGQSV